MFPLKIQAKYFHFAVRLGPNNFGTKILKLNPFYDVTYRISKTENLNFFHCELEDSTGAQLTIDW